MTSEKLERLFRRAEDLLPDMMSTWGYLVDHDCGTANKAGVDHLGQVTARFLEKCGFSVRFSRYEKAGNMLIAEKGDTSKPFICLVGHLDTVFPDGESAERPFTVRNGRATGPGCLDMKGGITVLLYAMKILSEEGWSRYPVKILITGDEEVAHKNSAAARDLVKEADGGFAGFNFETAWTDNAVVLGRLGYALYDVRVKGVAAHAGNNPEDGRSAVIELAHKIIEIDSLANHEEGTLINVGIVQGGTVANTIPEDARCTVDVRFKKTAEMDRIRTEMERIRGKVFVEGTETEMTLKVDVPAMERTNRSEELFSRVNAIALGAGLPEMHPITTGGGSDSVFLSRAGVPTLCGLGVKGEFNHTDREYAVVDSLLEREKLILAVLTEL